MVLGFSTKYPKGKGSLSGRATKFPEKIWFSIASFLEDEEYYKWHGEEGILNHNMGNNFNDSLFNEIISKHHTIRRDNKNRWKKGNSIHFSIGVRTNNQFRFAPVLKVVSTQRINIFKVAPVSTPYTIKSNGITRQVEIDGRCLKKEEIKQLALNDGFDSVDDFFEWFNTDFSGKIIHWTNLQY